MIVLRARGTGITYIEGMVRGSSEKQEPVRFPIDSGTTYSLLPKTVWESNELVPKRGQTFSLADGSTIERQISECHITITED